MNILLQGYFDRNFGDDMMMRIVMERLKDYNFYAEVSRSELLQPFEDINNFNRGTSVPRYFDACLRVTGSGFLIRSTSGTFYTLSRIHRMSHEKRMFGVRAVIGCNVGPFKNSFAQRVSMHEIRKYDFITVRDNASAEILNANHVKWQQGVYPDIVFSLENGKIPPKSGDCLGISAYRRINTDNMPLYRTLAATADDYIERTGKKVLLFAFDVEDENDLCAAHTIQQLCRRADKTEIVCHHGSAILDGFARCSKIVAIRFHSAVLALRMGIPLVPVTYSAKTDNVLSDLGCDKPSFSVNSVDAEALIETLKTADTPFKLPESLIARANGHVDSFRTFLEGVKK
ncbi:MAG: polysaccharide pyruvyl transferase family protein [Clostridia bacterium]|nr:polysaccharide pyruvyl transferase family protein [Clostridia bacterium]